MSEKTKNIQNKKRNDLLNPSLNAVEGIEKLDLTRNLRKKIAKAAVPGLGPVIDKIDIILKDNGLGAAEIIQQNQTYSGKSIYFPTYDILNNYDHLIEQALNKLIGYVEGGLNDTIKIIKEIVTKYSFQVKKLAQHLKADSDIQTAFNIWHWLTSNIPFRIELDEELRTPARSYYIDRYSGIDCDDYSIFAACLLTCLGYDYQFNIVAFNYKPNYGHIYVVFNDIIIDGVMKEFNQHPQNITKTKIIPMKIRTLAGVQIEASNLDEKTSLLLDHYNYFESLLNEAETIDEKENLQSELRKIKAVLMLSGTSLQDDYINLMGIVDYVDEDYNFYINDEQLSGLASEYIETVENLQGLGDLDGLEGIRDKFKNLVNNVKNTVKNTVNKGTTTVKNTINKGGSTVKNIINKGGSIIKNTVTNVTNAVKNGTVTNTFKKFTLSGPRAAFLLLLKVNFLKLSSKLYFGYMSETEAKSHNLDMNEWKKAVAVRKETETKFKNYGGDATKLKKAVLTGRGQKKALKDIDEAQFENDPDLKGFVDQLYGLGVEPATGGVIASAIATATPLWSWLKTRFKTVNWDKFFKTAQGVTDIAEDIIDNDKNNNNNSDDYNFDDNDDDDNGNGNNDNEFNIKKLWWVPLVAGGVIIVSSGGSKKGKKRR